MKNPLLNIKKQKDITPALCVILGLCLLCAKLILSRSQQVFLWPEEALLDDMTMYNAAVSITQGEWLGEYGYLTLAKNSFFALWLAAVHMLGLPFLLAAQIMWATASLAGAACISPVLTKNWQKLALFGILLFNPASLANPDTVGGIYPVGFTSRVYRDSIFPALCLLVVAGMVGFALRYKEKPRRWLGWLLMAGLSLAACWLCREDGWWILPFVVFIMLLVAWGLWRSKDMPKKEKAKRVLGILLPIVLLLAGVLAWAGMNKAVYGSFITNDFSTGEFADAYGAMTRIEHEDWDPKIAVPRDVRMQLYEHAPSVAELEPLLESEWYLGRYAGEDENADYSSGAFYWALREAASELGYYDTPQKSAEYFSQMAAEINALCDEGVLNATAARSSVSPPIKPQYVLPVLVEGFYGMWFSATFMQCDVESIFSPHSNDGKFYEETILPMEDFLGEKVLRTTKENSTEPYYNLFQRMAYAIFSVVRFVYSIITPIAFLLALVWMAWQGLDIWQKLRRKENAGDQGAIWMLMLGLLMCMFLRSFMVAFVTVSSFQIGTFVMYLASIHPLMLIFSFVGSCRFLMLLCKRRLRR